MEPSGSGYIEGLDLENGYDQQVGDHADDHGEQPRKLSKVTPFIPLRKLSGIPKRQRIR